MDRLSWVLHCVNCLKELKFFPSVKGNPPATSGRRTNAHLMHSSDNNRNAGREAESGPESPGNDQQLPNKTLSFIARVLFKQFALSINN